MYYWLPIKGTVSGENTTYDIMKLGTNCVGGGNKTKVFSEAETRIHENTKYDQS